MGILIIIALIVLNIPLYKVYFRMMFESMEDFNECIRYSFTPDIISLFRGEYCRDYFGEMKLGIFIFLCCGSIWLEYTIIRTIFSNFT